jgi:hypothetical protein
LLLLRGCLLPLRKCAAVKDQTLKANWRHGKLTSHVLSVWELASSFTLPTHWGLRGLQITATRTTENVGLNQYWIEKGSTEIARGPVEETDERTVGAQIKELVKEHRCTLPKIS